MFFSVCGIDKLVQGKKSIKAKQKYQNIWLKMLPLRMDKPCNKKSFSKKYNTPTQMAKTTELCHNQLPTMLILLEKILVYVKDKMVEWQFGNKPEMGKWVRNEWNKIDVIHCKQLSGSVCMCVCVCEHIYIYIYIIWIFW